MEAAGSRARKPRRDAPKAECLSYAADTMSEDAQRPSRMVEAAGVEPASERPVAAELYMLIRP